MNEFTSVCALVKAGTVSHEMISRSLRSRPLDVRTNLQDLRTLGSRKPNAA